MKSFKIVDARLSAHIRRWSPKLRGYMTAMTYAGSPSVVTLFGVVTAVVAIALNYLPLAIAFGIGSVALLINTAIKITTRRVRPDTPYSRTMRYKTYSFPSGHTFGATVLYGLVAASAYRYADVLVVFPATLLAVVLIISIGLSRIYLGAHYAGDVIGGWLLGAGALAIIMLTTSQL